MAVLVPTMRELRFRPWSSMQAYHATEDTELGKPVQVEAAESNSQGPWTVTWAQTVPQLLRFKVRGD